MGRLSFAETGDAVYAELVSDGRRRIAMYERKSQRVKILTEGPNHEDPIMFPDGRVFALIDMGEPRGIKRCALEGPPVPYVDRRSWCGPSAWRFSSGKEGGLSREGSTGDTHPSFDSGDGKTEDLGPWTNRCRLRWKSEDSFWIFSRLEAFTGWSEFDVLSRRLTGKRESLTEPIDSPCPDEWGPDVPGRPKLVPRDEAEIGGYPHRWNSRGHMADSPRLLAFRKSPEFALQAFDSSQAGTSVVDWRTDPSTSLRAGVPSSSGSTSSHVDLNPALEVASGLEHPEPRLLRPA